MGELLVRVTSMGLASGRFVNRSLYSDTPPYPGLTVDAIERDLRAELPGWILSCYGPGRDAPEQLWGGYPREQSVEEIRLHFMMGAMAGNPQGAVGSPPFGVLPDSC